VPPEPDPAPDGLDLARTLARVTARSTPGRKSAVRRSTTRAPRTGRVSGAHPDDRDPQPLDAALTRVVDDHGWQVDLKVASMFARWAELVGAEVGAHSRAESFADGKLVVRTDSTACRSDGRSDVWGPVRPPVRRSATGFRAV
jgi:predicted nucleic acid-binding Zn ribbon protein